MRGVGEEWGRRGMPLLSGVVSGLGLVGGWPFPTLPFPSSELPVELGEMCGLV